LKILFFGKLGEAIGREVEMGLDPGSVTVAELRAFLARRYPAVAADLRSPGLRACVGDTIVGEDFRIGPEASVEFFPPLSGG
jgi:molybdopterin converting factor small subunit